MGEGQLVITAVILPLDSARSGKTATDAKGFAEGKQHEITDFRLHYLSLEGSAMPLNERGGRRDRYNATFRLTLPILRPPLALYR